MRDRDSGGGLPATPALLGMRTRIVARRWGRDLRVAQCCLEHAGQYSGPGARRSTVWTVKARMGAVRALGRQLKDSGIEMVTLESASDYWRIWFFVLLRHEAPFDRMGVKGPCPWAVAAA